MKISLSLCLILLLSNSMKTNAQSTQITPTSLLWSSKIKNEQPDTHTAFRGSFFLESETTVEILLSGASWYVVWLDGEYFFEGPDRYAPMFPEYQSKKIKLTKGYHLLAIQVHYSGLDTRILDDIQPFLFCKLLGAKKEIPVSWKYELLKGYDSEVHRINNQLSWIEWLDTRALQNDWKTASFNDSDWKEPVSVTRELGTFTKSKIGNVKALDIFPEIIDQGKLAETYGYEKDNPSARFFLRDLECEKLPPQGVWKRYDLGRIRLSRPKFVLDLPEGAVVEFAYSEYLSHGRVAPWITLSLTDSYNLDHFVAKGGIQEFFPMHPKGGRFVEIHIIASVDKIKFIEEKFIERVYYDEQQGYFSCEDPILNTIWQTGVETLKSCAEDAITDNPTRERGQWLGDGAIVGMQIAAAVFSDIRVNRRGLVQSAQCAREDGMVAGLFPGGESYLSTFAAQWLSACMNYWKLTGDIALLEELYNAAEKNIEAFQNQLTEWGISNDMGWGFMDWGYIPNEESSDMGLNLYYYLALQDMIKWSELLNKTSDSQKYHQYADKMFEILSKWYLLHKSPEGYDWNKIGYHRAVLGLKAGIIPETEQRATIEYIKKHILNCFPNNLEAPRLSDPSANNSQLITPYFAHIAFPVLIENGEMDFVLDQYRISWGWLLEDDRTTWLEVFDTRWSHSHHWSGCPTWQLSHYALGLHPSFDKGKNVFDFNFHPGSLNKAEGSIPLPGGEKILITWQSIKGKIEYELTTDVPIWISIPEDINASKKGVIEVKKQIKFTIEL